MTEWLKPLADPIGMFGVFLVLLAYFLLNIDKFSSKDMTYLLLNGIGSSLIAFSLLFNWNLPAFLIEVAWMFISLLGIYRILI